MPEDTAFPIWGGANVRQPNTHRPLANTFEEFVGACITRPVQIGATEEEWDAMSEDEKDEAKKVGFFIACTLKYSREQARSKVGIDRKSPQAMRLACFDIDDADSSMPCTPAELRVKIPWNFVCYTTAKHTPESPRYRIVVELSRGHPVEGHHRVIRFLADKVGLPEKWKGRVESKKASQPMFFPIMCSDSPDNTSRIVASRLKGKALAPEELPPEEEEIPQDSDDMFAGLPVTGVTMEDAVRMLDHLDPDVSRDEWIRIALALKHQFRGGEAAPAFRIFDEWSSKGTKYPGREEILTQWKSAREAPDDVSKAVTLRTVMRLASDAGFSLAQDLAAREFDILTEWINSATDADKLLTEGPKKIADARISGLEEPKIDALQSRLISALKALGHAVRRAVIEKAITAIVRKWQEEEDAKKPKPEAPSWLRPYVFIAGMGQGGAYVHRQTGLNLGPAAFDRKFSPLMMEHGKKTDSVPEHQAGDWARNFVQMAQADKDSYDPRESPRAIFRGSDGSRLFNAYCPRFPVETSAGSVEAGEILTAHLRMLAGGDEEGKILLRFLAHIVQFPGIKIRWIPLIRSQQGTGKSLVGKIMTGATGGQVNFVEPDQQNEKYTEWMGRCVLVVLEEISQSGENREKQSDRLKVWIANDVVRVREMWSSSSQVENLSNGIAFTNKDTGAYIEDGDRRYAVFHCSLTPDQIRKMVKDGYFAKLAKWTKPEHAGSMRHFLMNVKIPDDFPIDGPAPHTTAKAAMMEDGQGEDFIEVRMLIDDEVFLEANHLVASSHHIRQHLAGLRLRFIRKPDVILSQMGYSTYRREDGRSAVFRISGHQTTLLVHSSYDFDVMGCPGEWLRDQIRDAQLDDMDSI